MDFLVSNWSWILLGGVALWVWIRRRGLACGMGHGPGDPTSRGEHTEAPSHATDTTPQSPQPAPECRRHGCC